MAGWIKKLLCWKRDQHVASPTRGTGSEDAHQGRPNRSPADRVAKETRAAAQSEESGFGIKVLVEGEDPSIDIVAVHGLDGHREKSWTADNGVLWLQTLLPKEIPNARVLTYGYDSRTRSSELLSRQTLYGHSMSLVSALSLYRRTTKTERRPIVFLAHSLGGIVVKGALIHSNTAGVSHNEHLKAIKLSTYGVVFFGTPHQGTDGASLGKVLANVSSIFQHTSTAILEHLERDSEWLELQSEQYKAISSDISTIFCFESLPTPLPARNSMMMVPKASAVVPGMRDAESVEIRKDHTKLVKFRNSSDDDFQTVIGHLSLMCGSAAEKVAQNWEHWEEVKALTADAWPNDFEIPPALGYNRNPNFTGRINDLDYMHKFLDDVRQKKRRPMPLVIHGTGGIGKTQLVREFVFAHSADFSSIIWIDARNPQNVRNGFASFMQKLLDCYVGKSRVTPPPYLRIARYLGISGLVGKDGQIAADSASSNRIMSACLEWFDREGNASWLLVFDNVDDIETFQISDFFPRRAQGSIIVTSRRPECSRLGEGWKVGIMEVQESIDLLSKSYGKTVQEGDDEYEEARRVVEKLGNLPLAIDQAGSYLSMLQKPLYAFLPLFEENFSKTLSKKPPSAVWHYGEETVVTTWEISFKAIQERDPQAADLLLRCSFISNDDIGVDFLRRGLPTQFLGASDIDDHLSTLFSFSLADRKREDSFSIHPIVHWWARERLSEEEAEGRVVLALRMIACAIDSLQSHNLATDRQIMQHIRVCDALCKTKISWGAHYNMDEFRGEWLSFGKMYRHHGRSIEGEDMLKRALAGYEKGLKADHPHTLGVVQNLGLLYHGRGQVDEAEKMLKRALAGYEKALEPDHPDTLAAVQNLGMLYHGRGQVDEAEKMWKRALVGYEKALEPDHPHTLAVVQNLGLLYHGRGQVDEAEKMWKRALAGYEKALEPDHSDTLGVVQNLGLLYHGRGQVDEAEKMWRRALAGYEKALELDHPDTLGVVQNLGMLYHGRGQVDEAEKMLRRALAGYEKALEPDHPDTLRVVQNLGALYHGRGQVDEAEKMWKRALAGYEKALELDHPQTLLVVQNLGMLYHGRGQVDEAEKMWKRALAGYEKALEPDHPDTLRVVQNLGALYHGRGQVDEAEKMWKRALAGYEKALELDHPQTLLVVQNLAMLYHGRGQVNEAEKMWKRALAGYERALVPDHPDTLRVVQNLGMLYHGRGQVDEAEKMLRRALAGYEKALEPDHPDTLRVVQNLGALYHGRGQVDEAEKMWKRALAGYERALVPDHPDTLRVVQNLGMLYHGRGQVDEAEKMWKRALAGYERALVPHHPKTSRVLFNLGGCYVDQGQFYEAEAILKRALLGYQHFRESHGKDLYDTQYMLGEVFERCGRLAEAKTAFADAKAGYEGLLGPEDSETVDAARRIDRV